MNPTTKTQAQQAYDEAVADYNSRKAQVAGTEPWCSWMTHADLVEEMEASGRRLTAAYLALQAAK